MIDIDQVYKSFGQLDVLQGVSMTVSKGEVISLIGGSGSGKSTLLMCIMRMLSDEGMTMILVIHEIGIPQQVIDDPQRPETAAFLKPSH